MIQKKTAKKILLIDDDPIILKIIEIRLLREKGFEILVAVDSKEGLRRAIEEKPDMVLLDFLMPRKDGFEILSRLKSNPKTKKIPIMIASALGQEEHIKKGLKLGAVDYVVKGKISIDDFVERIKKIIASKGK